MGFKIDKIIDITVYNSQTHEPILYLGKDDIDPTLEFICDTQEIDPKYHDNRVYLNFNKGEKDFEINGFLEVFS